VRVQPKRGARLTAAGRREQLLDVTARLLGERGFHGISIEAISAAAGVTRATVYLHFKDLQELLEAVIERETARALAQFSETALAPLDQGEPRELMLEALDAYLHAVVSQPTTWRLMLMPAKGAPPALRRTLAAGRATALARLAQAVQPLVDLSPDMPDAELSARILSTMSDEYARLLLADPDRYPIERLLDHARWWLRRGPFERAATELDA
jgi:AcrR family transcriptional regulator